MHTRKRKKEKRASKTSMSTQYIVVGQCWTAAKAEDPKVAQGTDWELTTSFGDREAMKEAMLEVLVEHQPSLSSL